MSASHPSHPSHHYSLVRVLSVLSQAWTNFVYSISISEGMVEAKVGAGAGAGAGSGHSSVSEEERIELIPADLRRMTFLLGQRPSEESGESDKAKGIGISKEGSKGVDERLDRKKYSKYQLVNLIDPPFFTPPVSSYATVEEGSDDDLEVSDQVGVLFPLPEAIKDGEIDFPHVRLARSINHESLSSSYSVEARLRFDPQAGCKLLVLTDTLESRLLTQVCARDLARRLSLSEEMGIMVYLPPQYREYAIADREYDQSVALLPGSSGYQHALGRFLVLEKLDFAELTKEDVENLELVGLIKLLSGETCEAFLNTVIQKGWIKFLEPADVKELIAICRSKELLLRVLESGHRDFSRTIFWGDFSGIDFTLYEGLIFSEVDFSCAVLTGSRLQNSILTRADFFDFRSSAWVHQARSIDLPELLSASQKREIWDETWGKLLANPKARQKFVAYCEETHSTANFDLSVPGAKAFLSELVKDEKWGLVRLFLDRGLCLEPEEALQVFEAECARENFSGNLDYLAILFQSSGEEDPAAFLLKLIQVGSVYSAQGILQLYPDLLKENPDLSKKALDSAVSKGQSGSPFAKVLVANGSIPDRFQTKALIQQELASPSLSWDRNYLTVLSRYGRLEITQKFWSMLQSREASDLYGIRLLSEVYPPVLDSRLEGRTPLLAASRSGFLDVVEVLCPLEESGLSRHSDFDVLDFNQRTPFAAAVAYQRLDIVNYFLAYFSSFSEPFMLNAVMHQRDQKERTPLAWLIQHFMDPSLLERFLESPDHARFESMSPIFVRDDASPAAIAIRHPESLALHPLLRSGVALTSAQRAALLAAELDKSEEAWDYGYIQQLSLPSLDLTVLRQHLSRFIQAQEIFKIQQLCQQYPSLINSRSSLSAAVKSATPLIEALVLLPDPQCMLEVLAELGAEFTLVDAEGYSVIHRAIEHQRWAVIDYLQSRSSKNALKQVTKSGETPLMVAARQGAVATTAGFSEAVPFAMLERLAFGLSREVVNYRDVLENQSALDRFVRAGCFGAVKFLVLRYGAEFSSPAQAQLALDYELGLSEEERNRRHILELFEQVGPLLIEPYFFSLVESNQVEKVALLGSYFPALANKAVGHIPPLVRAVQLESPAMVGCLLNLGAEVAGMDQDQNGSLSWALKTKNFPIFEQLMRQPVSAGEPLILFSKNMERQTLLHVAVLSDCELRFFGLILEILGGFPNRRVIFINEPDGVRRTALDYLLWRMNHPRDILRLLVMHGATIRPFDAERAALAELEAFEPALSPAYIDFLLKKLFETERAQLFSKLITHDSEDLSFKSSRGYLLASVCPDLICSKVGAGSTVLHEVAKSGRVLTLQALLALRPEAVNLLDEDRNTLLMVSLRAGASASFVTRELLGKVKQRSGVIPDVTLVNRSGDTALMCAIQSQFFSPEVFDLIVLSSAVINHQNGQHTALSLAAYILKYSSPSLRSQRIQVVKKLIEEGAIVLPAQAAFILEYLVWLPMTYDFFNAERNFVLQLLRLQLNSPEGRGIGEEAGKALLSLMIQDPEGLDAFLLILKSPSIKTYPTQIFPQGFAEEICRYLMGRATERSGGVSLGVSVSGGASGAGAGKGSSEISRELDTSEVLRLFAKLKLTKSMIEKMITGLPDRNLKLAVLNQILNKLPEDKDSLVAKIFWTPKGKVWHPAKKVTKGTLGRLILMRQTILYQEEAERAAQEAQGREAMRAAVLGSDPEGRFAFTFLGQVPTAPPMASTAPQGFVEATAIPVVPTAPPMASSATQGFGEATVIPVVPTAPPMAASDPMGFVEPVGTLPVFAGVVFPVAPTGPVVAQVTSFAAGAAEKKPEVLVPS